MAVVLDDVMTALETAGLVNVTGAAWVGFKSYLPPEPDQALAIVETGGREPDVDFVFPTLQVLVRGAVMDYAGARDQMDKVFKALHNATIAGYVYVLATSDPTPVGRDENNRPVLSLPIKLMLPQ